MEGEDRNAQGEADDIFRGTSPSVWRARIETNNSQQMTAVNIVALRMEGEDRNAQGEADDIFRGTSPSVWRARIETASSTAPNAGAMVALRMEGEQTVDKPRQRSNFLKEPEKTKRERHPSRRI